MDLGGASSAADALASGSTPGGVRPTAARRWAWHAQISAEQTARVQAEKAARREASARACPITDAEIALYGAQHHDLTAEAEREALLTAPTGHDEPGAHETTGQYHARMQSYAQWQPAAHPEANAETTARPEARPDEPDLEP